MENENGTKPSKEKDPSTVDRVILGKSEAHLLQSWVNEFNKKADGLIKVSKADLVNYLIASHAVSLSSEEVHSIATRYYDEARWLGWAMHKLKEAKKNKNQMSFDELTVFRNSFLTVNKQSTKKRTRNTHEQEAEPPNTTTDQSIAKKIKPVA